MKKIFIYLLSAFVVLSFAACSDDDIDDPVVETPDDSTDEEEEDNNDGTETGGEGEDDTTAQWTSISASPEVWDGAKRAAITYQALVYSFADSDGDDIGDINGIINKLDYLEEMGVSAIWLSPIHPSSSYHGYDVKDYSAVNPDLGTESDLQNLINAAKERDIKIYLDYVLNHSSYEHPWFLDAVENGEESEYWDFYAFSKDPESDIAAGNIAQIASEGASGYDSGQWFSSSSDAGAEGYYKFVLDWSTTRPTLTVTEATSADVDETNTDTSSGGKYIYFGNGDCLRFYETGTDTYELTVDFASDWGFLIRTSTSSWAAGTKYGAPDNTTIVELGEPFTLYVSTSSFDPVNIQFTAAWMYHSHFWTSWFVDFNYGAADEAEQSGAFKALAQCGDKWVNMGVAGFRLDAVKHIYHNATSDENPTFLAKFYNRMNQSYQAAGGEGDFYMVGEMLSEYYEAAPYYAGLPALFEFSFWYRLKWALQNNTGCYFAKDILSYQDIYASYRSDYIEATKLSNHDETRTGSDLNKNTNKMKLAGAMLLTAGGEPYIYQGEELGYWGTQSSGDEYVRTPIMWDQAGTEVADGYLDGKVDNSMLTSSISVEYQEEAESSILNVYRQFGKLRNTYPALAEGKMVEHGTYNSSNTTYSTIACWYMVADEGKALVIHNLGTNTVELDLSSDDLSKPIGLLGTAKVSADGKSLQIGAFSSVVFDE